MSLPRYEPKHETYQQVQRAFTYHPPAGDQAERYGELRAGGYDLASLVLRNCPPSREQSLALTMIEDAVMWANAAIARNETQEFARGAGRSGTAG